MLELLAFALIVGHREIGPGLYETQYLVNSTEIVTIVEDVD